MSKTTNRFSPEVRTYRSNGSGHANDILLEASAYFAMIEGNAALLRTLPEMPDRRSK
ncbi:hypothetical protein [Paenirhodobacter populi]|uniref:hypothetical protein n=1 Tax=Paenirhodobacter populi TaxID=2306993 RepID=UPI0013E37987|nr:hypothetical protein [Sinirhodobacter populi]